MKDSSFNRAHLKVGILLLIPLLLSGAATLGQEPVVAQQQTSEKRANTRVKQLTPRVRYKRISPNSSLRKSLSRLEEKLSSQTQSSEVRTLSVTRGQNGFVAARLDPLSVMGFAVLERNPEGETVIACRKQPLLESGTSTFSKGGRP